MKKNIFKASLIIALLFLATYSIATQAKYYFVEGNITELNGASTGEAIVGAPDNSTRYERSIMPETDSTYYLGKTSEAWLGITSNEFCLTGDSCISTWAAGSGIVYSDLSASAPLTYNNLTGEFGINQSDTDTDGYLSSTDWDTFNNKGDGTVTSVSMTVPTGFSISGSPITTSGTFGLTFAGGYELPLTASTTNWDTAYGWGNHAGLYLPLAGGIVTASSTFQDDLTVGGNLSVTGTIGSALSRVEKGWFTDLEITNAVVGGLIAFNASSGILLKNYSGNTVASFGVGGADSYNVLLAGNTSNTGTFSVTGKTTLGQASTTNLTVSSNSYLGTIQSGTWNGTAIDISDYTNLAVSGTLLDLTGDTLSINEGTLTDTKLCTYESGTGIVCNTADANTTYTGGTNLTLAGTTFNVDDAFLLNNGDTGTGVYDFGGATSFEIPNGASPTVDTAGEIAQDTTSDYLLYGATPNVLAPFSEKCFTVASTTYENFDNVPLWSPNKAITVTDMYCRVDGGTSVVATLGDGTNNMDSITCSTSGQADDGSIANNTFTANERMEVDFGTVTGATNWLNYCITYTQTRD